MEKSNFSAINPQEIERELAQARLQIKEFEQAMNSVNSLGALLSEVIVAHLSGDVAEARRLLDVFAAKNPNLIRGNSTVH